MKTLFACFSQNLDYALGWMVIHSLWQAISIALLMSVLMIVLRKKRARVRYWVANASLLMVLLSAVITFAYYYDFSKDAADMRFIPDAGAPFSIGETVYTVPENAPALISNGISLSVFKNYFNEHIPLIVLIWTMGVALFILKLLGGISYCYYLRSRLNFPADEYWLETLDKLKQKVGVKQSIELVESALTRTPMVVGILKPMILFPIGAINRLSPTEVEAILAHEIAHVLRKDYIFNIIQSIIEALFYFHPAVWWISSIIRNERENCCDDVAIEICGSSMNYAKALVTVQEMAYYPMYQPALAFAGNRKNQLLYRVQRILNQPQNKTNVMEKLIATCLLVIMMVGLSFGDNSFDPYNNHLSATNQENTEGDNQISETGRKKSSDIKAATFFVKYKVNGELDSFPLSKQAKDGTYNYEDNTQKVRMTVLDNMVTSFNINNVEMAKSDISKFEKLINKIIINDTRSNKNTSDDIFSINPPAYTEGGQRQHMNIDKNGFYFNGADENGNNFFMKIDENGFKMDGADEKGQNFNMNINKNGLNLNSNNGTYIKNGVVTTFDDNGHKWVIKPEKDGVKFIEHFDSNEKLIEKIKMQNNKVYINNKEATQEELRQRGWEIDDNGIQRIGGFKNLQPNEHRSGNLNYMRSELKARLKSLTDKGLALKRAKGIDVFTSINPTLNEAGRELSKDNTSIDILRNAERKLDWVEKFIDSKEDNDDNKDDFQSSVNDLRNEIKELRHEIKECQCAANFDFRKDLTEKLNVLMSALESSSSQNQLNAIELKFSKLSQEWERGECDDVKKTGNTDFNSTNGQNKSIITYTAPSAYNYGVGNSYAAAEKARKDAAMRSVRDKRWSVDASDNSKAINDLFKSLLDQGLVKLNKKVQVEFDSKRLKIDGKIIDNAIFSSIKNRFEANLNRKNGYSVSLNGIIKSITGRGVEMEGTLNVSESDDK